MLASAGYRAIWGTIAIPTPIAVEWVTKMLNNVGPSECPLRRLFPKHFGARPLCIKTHTLSDTNLWTQEVTPCALSLLSWP